MRRLGQRQLDALFEIDGDRMTLPHGQIRVDQHMDIHEQLPPQPARAELMPAPEAALLVQHLFDRLDGFPARAVFGQFVYTLEENLDGPAMIMSPTTTAAN